jgi:hypothetical protein
MRSNVNGSGIAIDQQRLHFIHAICSIQTDRAIERIESLKTTACKKANFQSTPTVEALYAAQFALERELNQQLHNARNDGLLLTCWRGSSVEQFAIHPGRPA